MDSFWNGMTYEDYTMNEILTAYYSIKYNKKLKRRKELNEKRKRKGMKYRK